MDRNIFPDVAELRMHAMMLRELSLDGDADMVSAVRTSRDREIVSSVQILRQIDRTQAFRVERCDFIITKIRKSLQRREAVETTCGKIRRDPRFRLACLLPDLQDGMHALQGAMSRCLVEQTLEEEWARLKAAGIKRFRLMAHDGERSCPWARAADGATFAIDEFPLPHPDCDRYACTCRRDIAGSKSRARAATDEAR